MKTCQSRRNTARVSKPRWFAYMTAGMASALTGNHSAEAAVHYSGFVNVRFHGPDVGHHFKLDQAGDGFSLYRDYYEGLIIDYFRIRGIASGSFRGTREGTLKIAFELSSGQTISKGHFTSNTGTMVYDNVGSWTQAGTGFIGFRFNNGAGLQYGWVRIKISGSPENSFKAIDYAYADPGEAIRAGQTSGDEPAPGEGSLGWLAFGAAGLFAWRKARSRYLR